MPTPTTGAGGNQSCDIFFADVPLGSTFHTYIDCLACKGVLSGYPCGQAPAGPCNSSNDPYFLPASNISRGQAAKILANVAGYAEEISQHRQSFKDVPVGSPFWLYVERVAARGIIGGYPCGASNEPCPGAYFRPGRPITRGQFAKIVSNVMGYDAPIPASAQTFTDVPQDHTFWLYVERIMGQGGGIISGYNCGASNEPCPGRYFRPQDQITRGQSAKIVSAAFFPDCDPGGN
jgi:hypothetical protein